MSDLIFLFGDNCENEVIVKPKNKIHNEFNGYEKGKEIKRPNTLKTRRNSYKCNSSQKQIKSTDHCSHLYNRESVVLQMTPTNGYNGLFHKPPNVLHNSLSCSDLPNDLPPENADGNIEYKRQLLNLTPIRLQHLITQLKWRLAEGEGEAIYEIGVDDNGKVTGLDDEELLETVTNLRKMADTLNASVSPLREYNVGSRKALEVLIRKIPSHFSTQETRVAVLGNMDAGKSTLIGVLTQGVLDNGKGKTRLTTFRHIHEVRSGRTSSISCQLLGFDENQNPYNFYWQKNRLHLRSHEEVVLCSSKLVTLIDLAGYHKYQRTTLFGLTTRRPHLVLLVIPANHGFKGTSVDHCQLAHTLKVQIAVVVTKIDRCSPRDAIYQLLTWLNARSNPQSISVISSISEAKHAASNMINENSVPVFPVSCVTGQGIDILTAFLGSFQTTEKQAKHDDAEVWIDQMYYEVPRVTGCVVSGLVYTGHIQANDRLYLGPKKDGKFMSVTVESIHRNRLQQDTVEEGQYASFALCLSKDLAEMNVRNCDRIKWMPQSPCSPVDDAECYIRRGMVLLDSLPISNINYLYKHVREDSSCQGQVACGIVVNNLRMLDEQEVCVNDLQKQHGSWIVHCGNVYQKSEMMDINSLFKNLETFYFPMDYVSKDIIFYFKLFPQFIHTDYPVVFHRADQTVKIYGNIKLLLGSEAFRKKKLNQKGAKLHLKQEMEDLAGYSDEYFTAPSSPV